MLDDFIAGSEHRSGIFATLGLFLILFDLILHHKCVIIMGRGQGVGQPDHLEKCLLRPRNTFTPHAKRVFCKRETRLIYTLYLAGTVSTATKRDER